MFFLGGMLVTGSANAINQVVEKAGSDKIVSVGFLGVSPDVTYQQTKESLAGQA